MTTPHASTQPTTSSTTCSLMMAIPPALPLSGTRPRNERTRPQACHRPPRYVSTTQHARHPHHGVNMEGDEKGEQGDEGKVGGGGQNYIFFGPPPPGTFFLLLCFVLSINSMFSFCSCHPHLLMAPNASLLMRHG